MQADMTLIPEPSEDWLRCQVDSFLGYVITVTVKDNSTDTQILHTSITDTYLLVGNLDVCTVYQLRIRVNNTVGEGPDSLPSEELTDSIAPSPIDSIQVSANSNTELYVKWTAPFSTCTVTDYSFTYQLIKRDQCEDMDGAINGGSTSITETTITLLESYSTYRVSVTARSNSASGNATYEDGITSEGVPETKPRNVTVVNSYIRSLNLSWLIPEVPNGIVSRYDIEAINTDTNMPMHYVALNTDELSVVYFDITQLEPDHSYSIQLKALTKAGDGPMSDPVVGHTLPMPSTVSTTKYTKSPTDPEDTAGADSLSSGIYEGQYMYLVRFIKYEVCDGDTYFSAMEAANSKNNHGPVSLRNMPAYIIQRKRSITRSFKEEFEALGAGSNEVDSPAKPTPLDNPYETKLQVKLNSHDYCLSYSTSLKLPYGVNAVFIHGHEKPNAYISAQGPLEDNVEDWWYMIWEKRVVVIVMANDVTENGESICEKYWPDEGELNKYEILIVQNMDEEMYGPQCTMRTLELTKLRLLLVVAAVTSIL
ncbi:putative receptor-type tyrosine-protein phosphatase mosPTP-1 [Amphiura filiformis]|uniref:putative receptor-type tyrosine-protein phosphatase mosPTP-1 n=1 Tax=Amphiura filiformis TaxID=82378 RepID=UPI003B21CA68